MGEVGEVVVYMIEVMGWLSTHASEVYVQNLRAWLSYMAGSNYWNFCDTGELSFGYFSPFIKESRDGAKKQGQIQILWRGCTTKEWHSWLVTVFFFLQNTSFNVVLESRRSYLGGGRGLCTPCTLPLGPPLCSSVSQSTNASHLCGLWSIPRPDQTYRLSLLVLWSERFFSEYSQLSFLSPQKPTYHLIWVDLINLISIWFLCSVPN